MASELAVHKHKPYTNNKPAGNVRRNRLWPRTRLLPSPNRLGPCYPTLFPAFCFASKQKIGRKQEKGKQIQLKRTTHPEQKPTQTKAQKQNKALNKKKHAHIQKDEALFLLPYRWAPDCCWQYYGGEGKTNIRRGVEECWESKSTPSVPFSFMPTAQLT